MAMLADFLLVFEARKLGWRRRRDNGWEAVAVVSGAGPEKHRVVTG
jgi:hypothetical protein